ncbi:UbiA prenyltransferase family [Hypoxylon fuscum]|nr:UbiA prenyltransferase family [Hypoxylon fuscum]
MYLRLLTWPVCIPYLFWEFTKSDFNTFVVPNTSFGILGAFASPAFSKEPSPSTSTILWNIPLVLLFNWLNVFNFDLANQRSPKSVREDRINKPWRPIVTGKVTPDQARRTMLVTIPAVLLFNYTLRIWRQGVFIQILTWMYNDLDGGDEIIRDLIISVAYGMFNSASLEIALGVENSNQISGRGMLWITIISGVILTTMQVQDLKDQRGDRTRGRQTVALLFGDRVSRISIAFFVTLWSLICPIFWGTGPLGYIITGTSGTVVALRVVKKSGLVEDRRTWKWWCCWTVVLYTLPLIHAIA